MGLRPLVVHVDVGWNSELAVKNIEQNWQKFRFRLDNTCCELGADAATSTFVLALRFGQPRCSSGPCIFCRALWLCNKGGIKNVINGSNFATESILPSSWGL